VGEILSEDTSTFRTKAGTRFEVELPVDLPITIKYEDGTHQHIKVSELLIAIDNLLKEYDLYKHK
jgi:hypothetical protein